MENPNLKAYGETFAKNIGLVLRGKIVQHGYDGINLENCILEENRHKPIKVGDDDPDLTDLRQAEPIITYLNHEMTGLGADTFFIEHAAAPETCHSVFHKIFTCMGPEQHYNMMVGIQTNLA